jgi:hypothetical protein
VKGKRELPKVAPSQTALGLPTIMDRDLAAAHGVRYVHLAVFAIDIDRVYWLDPEAPDLAFGWEVFLTELFLLSHLSAASLEHRELLEAICMPLLEETPGEPPLGGQLVFAVYDAVQRGELPVELRKLFFGWRSPPRELLAGLAQLQQNVQSSLPALVEYCLAAELSPPLAPPTREALSKMLNGLIPPPGEAPPAGVVPPDAAEGGS